MIQEKHVNANDAEWYPVKSKRSHKKIIEDANIGQIIRYEQLRPQINDMQSMRPTDQMECSKEYDKSSASWTAKIRIWRKLKSIRVWMNARNNIQPCIPQFKDAMKLWYHKTRWITRRRPKLENLLKGNPHCTMKEVQGNK